MSWGWRIAILYCAFVALILLLVFKSMNQHVDLVADDYYQQELKFQQQIDRTEAAATLPEQPVASVTADRVQIKFPEAVSKEAITGQVKFYRPSDASKDQAMALQVNDGVQEFSSAQLEKGFYQVKLNWNADGKDYYNELSVYIP